MDRKYSSLGLALYLAAIDFKHLCNSFHFLVGGASTFFPVVNSLLQISILAFFFLYFPDRCVNIRMVFTNELEAIVPAFPHVVGTMHFVNSYFVLIP